MKSSIPKDVEGDNSFKNVSSKVSKDVLKRLSFQDKILYFTYNTLLLVLLPILLPYFITKIIFTGKYRRGLLERFGFFDKEKIKSLQGNPSMWLHAVSVGEVNAAVPLVNRLKERYPELRLTVSTVTLTGYENAVKKIPTADLVFFFPLDLSWVVRRVVRMLKPKIFIIIETEIWPNILRVLHDSGIPTLLINGRISSASFKRYKVFRFFFKSVLKGFSLFSMQSERDSKRIISLGAEREKVVTAGNIKFDQAPLSSDYQEISTLHKDLLFSPEDKVFIAGSTHRGEEEIILEVFGSLKENFPGLKLLLAPRHPERFNEVEDLIKKKGFSLIRKTALDRVKKTSFDVILLDTIGELKMIYGLGTIVFVGGSLVKKGGHNLLEPASYRKPVFFGPFVDNFSYIARALLRVSGGIKVMNGDELLYHARRFLSNPLLIEKAGNSALRVLKEGGGAIECNMKLIDTFIQ